MGENGFDLLQSESNEFQANRTGLNNFSIYSANNNIQNDDGSVNIRRRTGNFENDGGDEEFDDIQMINSLANFHENFSKFQEYDRKHASSISAMSKSTTIRNYLMTSIININ
jgi:hypothetical protein